MAPRISSLDVSAGIIDSNAVVRANVDQNGNQAIGAGSQTNTLSPDGNLAYFTTAASNLVEGDTSGEDRFVKNLTTGEIDKLTSLVAGQVTHELGGTAAVSANGQYMAYVTNAGIAPNDTNNRNDIYRYDFTTQTSDAVSTKFGGSFPNQVSFISPPFGADTPDISADGRYIVFASVMSDQVSGDSNQSADIFVRDMQGTAGAQRVSTNSAGQQASLPFTGGANSVHPAISADGRYVVFESSASDLVGGDTNNFTDIFRKDLLTGITERVSVASDGTQANSSSLWADISADGRYVVFESTASNLMPNDTNGSNDIFRKDMVTGEIVRVSTAADGSQAVGVSTRPFVSDDGRYVLFASEASNLVTGDTNGQTDIFRADLAALAANSAVAENRTVQLQLGSDDASAVSVLWGDGATTALSGGPTFALSHTYAATGTFNVTVTLTDDSLQSSQTAYVVALADPNIAFSATSVGSNANDIILASTLRDVINARGGNDSVFGGGGNDALNGAAGNDFLAGGSGNDNLIGGAGADTLDGGTGSDHMTGGAGNDVYYVDVQADIVTEAAGQGRDTVYASVNYTLRAGTEVENLYANANGAGLKLTGNEFANHILGGAGADTLVGGAGDDVLQGGGGRDTLFGGAGADTFKFVALSESPVGANRDVVRDFVSGADKIDLSVIDAVAGTPADDAFTFIGGGFTHTAGELRAYVAGANTLVVGDVNGDGQADFQIMVSGLPTLTASDFIL